MNQNNNLSVLPFYPSIDEQNHRRSYSYGDIYPLYTPCGHVPPFQVCVPTSNATIQGVMLYKADGTQVGAITQQLTTGGLTKMSYAAYGYDVIVYPASIVAGVMTEQGQYYMMILMSDDTWYYSDIMTAVPDISPYLKIEWYDMEDMVMDDCRIVYEMGGGEEFHNIMYLNTEIGKPEYTFEEQGENRDGFFFPEKQLSEKTYRFTFLAAEYVCDVMRFIRMADSIVITDKYGREYRCDTFLMTPKWETQGNLASVEVEFQTNTVAKRIGRAYTSNN